MVKKSHILMSLIVVLSIGISPADQAEKAAARKFGILADAIESLKKLRQKDSVATPSKPPLAEDPSLKDLHVVIKLETKEHHAKHI